MSGKINLSGGVSPIDVSQLTQSQQQTQQTKNDTGNLNGLTVKSVSPTEDKPVLLEASSGKQKGGNGVSDPFSKDPNVTPGHDSAGPGNSENAPGHNKEKEVVAPPPPAPELTHQEAEHNYQLQQTVKQDLRTNDISFRRETDRRQTIQQRTEIKQNDSEQNKIALEQGRPTASVK